MSSTNIELFKEFLTSGVSVKAFASSKDMGYSAMGALIRRTERIFDGHIIPVEDYFPEHCAEYRARHSWANEPDYKHHPPSPIWNRDQWLRFIQAHEDLSERAQSLATDARKVSDLTVAELVSIIKATMLSGGN